MSGRLAGRQKAQERLAELVTQLDRDGDGHVSKAEFADGPTTGSSATRKWPLFEPNWPEPTQQPADPSERECIEARRSERHGRPYRPPGDETSQ